MALALTILSLTCACYGILIMLQRSGTLFHLVWYVLAALFALAAWAWRAGLVGAMPYGLRLALMIVVLSCLAVFTLVLSKILSVRVVEAEPDLDYLIVLGAQIRPSGMPSPVLRYRLDAALDYLRANPATVCIVSGGRGYNEPLSEAEGMAAYLMAHGVDAEAILCEDRSRNTHENIAFSMVLVDSASARFGIVTNDFHLYRACRIAKRCGLVHVFGIAAPSTPIFLPNNLLRESLGLIKDYVAGNV